MADSGKEKKLDDLISKLQKNLEDVWRAQFADCNYMAKWLKARDYDLTKAELMIRAHLQWRENEDIDGILDNFQIPEVFEKFGFGGYCGHDKEGRPVWYEAFGRADPQGILKCISSDDVLKSRIFIIEQMLKFTLPEISRQRGEVVNQTIALFDMEHFGRKHLWRPAMACTIEATKVMEANYPEAMFKLYIFNAPAIFRIAFNLVKPFLHQATRNKITFLGKKFKENLLDIIDADQLPAYYGGNMYGPDNDPMCRHLIRWGGEVPPSFYLTEHREQMINVAIKPRSKLKLSYLISKPDTVLYYEYSLKENDISFGIYYIGEEMFGDVDKIKSSHLESILHFHKKLSNTIVEKGEVASLQAGFYLIEFDNSYSWTKTKHVQYHIEVLDIVEHENYL